MIEAVLQENVRTLANLLGINPDRAYDLLDRSVAVIFDKANTDQALFAIFLSDLLTRTLTTIELNPEAVDGYDVVVFLNDGETVRSAHTIFVRLSAKSIVIGDRLIDATDSGPLQKLQLLLGACYAAAQAVSFIVAEEQLIPAGETLNVQFDEIFGASFPYDQWVEFGEAFLAGAGAIGNGFVLALSLLKPSGKLFIADPDYVDGGNLNRCLLFTENDIGLNKAKRLVANSQSMFERLELVARPLELQKVPEKSDSAWLKTLIVGVDSRRVRRHLQNELPGQVFDASTTDVREVVLHFNKQPLKGLACLSCIYFSDEAERSHEDHVAEALGLSVEEVEQNFISSEMANKIVEKYPELDPKNLQGLACDSLFKQLCGEGNLKAAEDRQVLAPFAFVSVLAGVYLAIETVKRIDHPGKASTFNYWRVSPWNNPVMRAKRNRPTRRECEYCSDPILVETADSLWNSKPRRTK